MKTKKQPPPFDESLRSLEEIVRSLEQGELALEKSLEAFDQGMALVRTLQERLAEAEQKVELLTRTPDGTLQVKPADPREDSGDA